MNTQLRKIGVALATGAGVAAGGYAGLRVGRCSHSDSVAASAADAN